MIGLLRGEILSLGADHCLLLVGGVGYECHCSTSTLAEIAPQFGKSPASLVTLQIYTHVREDALQLFGFAEVLEKNLFLALLKVNGIGPKSALQILSGTTPRELSHLIETEDAKALSKLPKVGKKTAEQMILTLKGKLVLDIDEKPTKSSGQEPQQLQLKSALVNLGFKTVDVEKVVVGLGELSFEEGLRQGLKALTHL